MVVFGRKIKLLRTKLKITQEEMSCDILSRSILSKIENDKVVPSIYQMNHIARKLGVSVDYFLNDGQALDKKENVSTNPLKALYEKEDYLGIINFLEKKQGVVLNYPSTTFYVGYAYFKLGFEKEGHLYLKKFLNDLTLLNSAQYLDEIGNIAKTYNTLAVHFIHKKKFSKAFDMFYKCKELLEGSNETHSLLYFQLCSNLGALYNEDNSYKDCINLLEDFLKKNTNNTIYINITAYIHVCLSSAYYNVEEYDQSINHVKKAIFFFKYIGDNKNSMDCYLNYINALRYSKEYEKALNIIEFLLEKPMENFDDNLNIAFTMQRAILEFNLDDFEKCAKELSTLKITSLDVYNRNCYYFMKGHVAFIKGDYPQSTYNFKCCETYLNSMKYNYDLHLMYKDLFEMHKNRRYKYHLDKLSLETSHRKNIVIP